MCEPFHDDHEHHEAECAEEEHNLWDEFEAEVEALVEEDRVDSFQNDAEDNVDYSQNDCELQIE
jgi:hypothetical protein